MIPAGRRLFGCIDVINTSTWGTTTHGLLEAKHGFGVAFGHDFHAAVVLIPDVPEHALDPRGIFDEHPEANALNAASDDVAAADEHEELYRCGRCGRCLEVREVRKEKGR